MILHVFTEEPSCMNVLGILLPKILPEEVEFRIYPPPRQAGFRAGTIDYFANNQQDTRFENYHIKRL